ncbi:Uncharacterized conserved protein, DUF427 family [Friedmanniella luteola]|uniref:Uncharacterized conserved protein, DUF427 family n=1 Tax=Friedmanniella luteola TaxID=546871 RepID=A0A1H1PF36_9ACTN|nr:DUF427 domain-containing protein [Friedmanniella luteola]SDS09842.1 Uncharacterized conserved protein, DUF427 family [Friedmanniella luteola]
MRTEPSQRWVRGYVGDVAVVDTRTPLLFWEDAFPVPGYAYDRADVREDLLRPTTVPPPEQPWFFLPQGPVSVWYDLVVDGRTLPHAAWTRDDPAVADRLVVSWQPGLLDRWLEEDEEVAGHPRDPHKRVDALPSSRHVVVSLDGVVLADSRSPVLLFETGLPTRYYLPPADVHLDALTPSRTRSHCPYKGDADRYWDVTDHPDGAGLAWSYTDPYPAVARIRDRVAFYDELVDVTVDGVRQPRPTSPFSTAAHRPAS